MNKTKKIILYITLIAMCVSLLLTMGGCRLLLLSSLTSGANRNSKEITKDGIRYFINKYSNTAEVLYFEADTSLAEGELQVCRVPESVKYRSKIYPVREIGRYNEHEIIKGNAQIGELVLTSAIFNAVLWYYEDLNSLQKITVENGNESYASVDGVLFNADKTELLFYPLGKTDEIFTLPKEFTYLESKSCFWDNQYLQNLAIENGSKSFSAVDGVLYSADGSTLMMYPSGRKVETFTAPKALKNINLNSHFWSNTNIQKVESVEGGFLKAVDNVLYTQDLQELVFRPRTDSKYFAIPSTVKVVSYNALLGVAYLYVPNSVVVFLDTLVNGTYSVTKISHIYFESEVMPKYLQEEKFSGHLHFGVQRESFDIMAGLQQGGTL